jgi:excisionase family DNA binding protein
VPHVGVVLIARATSCRPGAADFGEQYCSDALYGISTPHLSAAPKQKSREMFYGVAARASPLKFKGLRDFFHQLRAKGALAFYTHPRIIDDMSTLLSTADAARELGVSLRRIQALVLAGRLAARRVGKQYVIDSRALEAVRVRKPGKPQKTSKKV